MDSPLTLAQCAAFLPAAVLVTLAPGPDNLMVLSLGIARGRRAGIAFGLGCALGCLNHTLLAALGIGALIAASPLAFTLLRIAGGIYLMRIGWLAIRHARPFGPSAPVTLPVDAPATLFRKGLIANAINPKVVLFFLAFLPQFVVGGDGAPQTQIAALGMLFTLTSVCIFGAIGWGAGQLGERLDRRPAIGAWLDRIAGGVFIALGLRLLLPG